MTQSSKKFRKTIDTVFASVNRVMKMCHEDVEIVEGYDNSFAYSSGDKHVTVSAYVNCEEFEYAPQFTIAALGNGNVERVTVYNADYMECAYVYAAICAALEV